MCDNTVLSDETLDKMFNGQSTRTIKEIKKDGNFLSLADSYIDMLSQHDNHLNEFITEYGNGSEKFIIELYRLLDDKKALIESERDIEKMGYNLFDVCKAQNAELLQKAT